jgi:hypothetical protein
MNLIMIDSNAQAYAGQAPLKFSTLFKVNLYSQDETIVQHAFYDIAHKYNLVHVDSEHTEELIKASSDCLYLIDLKNKIIATDYSYENINLIRVMQLLNKLSPNILENDKDKYLSNVKNLVQANVLKIDSSTSELLLTCIDNHFNHQDRLKKSLSIFEQHLQKEDIYEIRLKTKEDDPNAWFIGQANTNSLSFYKNIYVHLLEQGVYINQTERDGLLAYLESEFDSEETQSVMDIVDSHLEQRHLDQIISFNDKTRHKIKV